MKNSRREDREMGVEKESQELRSFRDGIMTEKFASLTSFVHQSHLAREEGK